MKMRFTVFTPTYNRAYTIERLYRSLQTQTFRDFEWIVIDDGSKDNTKELFEKWSKEDNFFHIKYCRVENGGKHRAINRGTQLAEGELFYIVDSDDCLPNEALEIADAVEKTIIAKENYAGICGVKGYYNGKSVGSSFCDAKYLDITSLERSKYGISGDKAEIFYLSILKNNPFPEFQGETFLTENVIWNRIAYQGYKLRFFNDTIYLCDYLPDGLSANSSVLFVKNPQGYGYSIYCDIVYGAVKKEEKWNHIYGYYGSMRGKLSLAQMACFVHEKKFTFISHVIYIRMLRKAKAILQPICQKMMKRLSS